MRRSHPLFVYNSEVVITNDCEDIYDMTVFEHRQTIVACVNNDISLKIPNFIDINENSSAFNEIFYSFLILVHFQKIMKSAWDLKRVISVGASNQF